MVGKQIKDNLTSVFEKYRNKVMFAYLFGSAAQDNMYPLSDIDIAVFLSEGTKSSYFNTKSYLHADFCRILKRNDIDLVVLNVTINIILLDEIVRYGIVLFDRNTDLRVNFENKVLHQSIDFKEQRLAVMGV